MEGHGKPIVRFIEGYDTRFIIPVYQRNYDWKEEQCKRLYDDLIEISNVSNKGKNHFFGSILFVNCTDQGEMLIIDGQQRITTVSLLLLALYKYLVSKKRTALKDLSGSKDISLSRILGYLTDPENKKDIKLISIEKDRKAYERLFENEEDYIQNSNLTINFLYFYNRIQKEEISPDQLFDAIKRLQIVAIGLKQGDDDPQLIFESLNSTGLDLQEADKIRNFILMGIANNEIQQKYYEKYWLKFEECTENKVDDFVRDYLTVKQDKIPNFKRIYFCFKDFVNDLLTKGQSWEEILDDMLQYVKIYKRILCFDEDKSPIGILLQRLSWLDMSVANPYLMELLKYWQDGKIGEENVIEVLKSVETYLFRRFVCGVPTNALNKIFALLHRDALKRIKEANYTDVVKYLLSPRARSNDSSGRMPDDDEFQKAIKERDFYSIRGKNRFYLFDRLECGDSKEGNHIFEKMRDEILSIEHVMPQNLNPIWREQLGSEAVRIYQTWKDRIANLTITAYNGKLSDKSFQEKRDMPNGFRESPLFLNNFMKNCERWTETELKEREEFMVKRFLELWPLPQTGYEPKQKIYATYPLDWDEDFYTNQEVRAVLYHGNRYLVSSWKEMFQQILQILNEMDYSKMRSLVETPNHLQTNFKSIADKNSVEVTPGIYVYSSTSTASKIGFLKKLLKIYEISGSEFEIEIC